MTTEIEEKCQELLETFIDVSLIDALAWVTANFVGLTLAAVEQKGGDVNSDIEVTVTVGGRDAVIFIRGVNP